MARFGRFRGWDPFAEFRRLQQEMSNLFEALDLPWEGWARPEEFPPVNVVSQGDDVVIYAELPGVSLEDVDISVLRDTITIRGERKPDPSLKDAEYQRRERLLGKFVRTVELPEGVLSDKAEAKYANGVLEIRMPRAPEAKPRRVEVKAG